jgi:esterase/lipase superfamily enzyme
MDICNCPGWFTTRLKQIAANLLLVALVSGCASVSLMTTRNVSPLVTIEVLFATDRMRENSDSLQDFYGSKRGTMQYGSCRVVLNPQIKSISSHADAGLWASADGEHVSGDMEIRQINVLDSVAFRKHLVTLAGLRGNKSALVFVHGFAMDFDRGVRTMARLTYELSYQGIPVLYSWPSNSSAAAYTGDMSAMDWSTPHLQEFLDGLAQIEELETIHLIAHSLGNRGLLAAIKELINRQQASPWKFGEIILVAPDVDADIFVRDIAPSITQTSSRITLYVSSMDFPLYLSRKLNLYPRIGDSNSGPLVVAGIETIDASNAITMEEGHAYFRKDPEVLSDLYYLINERRGADERPTLKVVDLPEGRYWQVEKTGSDRLEE